MRHLLLLMAIIEAISAFTVVPYIQIDYAHYFRLAQCQAKCMQKYGVPSSRVLLDGSIEEFLDSKNSACEACESGCHQHRRYHGKAKGPKVPTKTAVDDGLKFWAESSADIAKVGSTIVSSIQLLCQNPAMDEEFGESSDGLIGISLLRPSGPTRFVVQWKQRTQAMGYYDESQWITASVESDTLLKVKGLIPGVQYRFMVTAVGPSGRLGETVESTWAEISSSGIPRTPGAALSIRNGYNSDRGVTAHLEWPRTPQDSCHYKLQLSNSTMTIHTDVTLDTSSSILLPNLEFDTDYTVTLTATSADKSQASKAVTANFKSLQCKDVHGRGSLQCIPEPVTDLSVFLLKNGTGLISWNPSADPENILFYQLVYHALSNENGCQEQKETINIKSVATSAVVDFTGYRCEYVVRLINYDLIGRDAAAETRVRIEPSRTVIRLDDLLRPEILIISACFVLFFLLCVLIRCKFGRKCPHRVSEKQQKLREYA
ncbi:fibronectin type III domain protein [Oesophagostomum dentatum]|uniref:Fibronectin type III domain protein n=1 Tax=Oesophagostomum dentatum TaxID=61180 RepID=A0A0B1SXS3_OESDE|nr:fibronectin type III domain protein [Oesophagostomum dentatum]